MLLKVLFNLLLAFFAYRLIRGFVGPRPADPGPRRTRTRRPGLDPDRAVPASWSEEEKESDAAR